MHSPGSTFSSSRHTASTGLYTLSLHDALPISAPSRLPVPDSAAATHRTCGNAPSRDWFEGRDRKSTRLNSSHTVISYAVFCLKKKNLHRRERRRGSGGSEDGLHPQDDLHCLLR